MHASSAKVTPEFEPSPTQPEPQREQPDASGSPSRWKRVGIVIAAIALLLGAIVAISYRGKPTGVGKFSQLTRAESGQILRLKGTTEAVQARAILAPLLAGQQVGTLTIIR